MARAAKKIEEDRFEIPHPRNLPILHGHQHAIDLILKSFHSGNMPHAWLLTGPKGIGKATLAYHIMRYIVSGANNQSLTIAPDDNTARRISQQSHLDVMVLQAGMLNDKGKPMQDISVDQARGVADFLRLTPAESPYRIVLIDSVDDMNTNAANAILKLLEEPTNRSLLFLVSHNPGTILPTIKSRCLKLSLLPPTKEEASIIAKQADPELGEAMFEEIFALTNSPGETLELIHLGLYDYYQNIIDTMLTLPDLNLAKVYSLADKLSGLEKAQWKNMEKLIATLFSSIIKGAASELLLSNQKLAPLCSLYSPAKWHQLYETIKIQLRQVDSLNMDKKQTIIAAFSQLKG